MNDKGEGILSAIGAIAVIAVIAIIIVGGLFTCSWLTGAGSIIAGENSPNAIYADYKWFINQKNTIDQMGANIQLLDDSLNQTEMVYTYPNGTHMLHTLWAETDLRHYNTYTGDRNGLVMQYNALVKDYNNEMQNVLTAWHDFGGNKYPSGDNWQALPRSYNEYIKRVPV